MTVTIGDEDYELARGEGVVIFPEQIHSLKSTDSKHVLVIFSPDIVSAYNSRHLSEIPCNNKISVPEYIRSQILDIDKSSSIIKIKAVLYWVCSMLDENTEYMKKRSGESGLLREIFDFVEKNYDKKCDLQSLSNALGYNSAYLSRYFGEAANMSYTSYLNRYKVSKACYILKNTDKTVLECAYECGYNSLRNFNRNFKSIIGLSPKEYRMKK
jgi:AraC-like DNA-binding protein